MHLNSDISEALQHIEIVKKSIEESSDPKLQINTADDIKLILDLLQDPVFRNIVKIQDSLAELNTQIAQHPSILPSDFDISTAGEIIISVPDSSEYDANFDEQRVPSAQISPRSPRSPLSSKMAYHSPAETAGAENIDLQVLKKARAYVDMTAGRHESEDERSAVSEPSKQQSHMDLLASEWAQIQAIELVNDGTGLGFGIIGAKSSGVIVKTILEGGVADRDGRLLSGDNILQIGDVNLHEMGSEMVASVLRQSGTHVKLIVARPIDPLQVVQDMDATAIVPSRLIADPVELKRYLAAAGYGDIFSSTPSTPNPSQNEHFVFREQQQLESTLLSHLPETERFTVELTKDYNGLGITIAGYVCEKEELSGIFVKSVSPGSAADLSGRIQVNDRIIEVDGQSLQGFSNHQAVDVLKQSGAVVKLCLERYLRGPKYEQLQQAIAANEMKTPGTPSSRHMTPTHQPDPVRRGSFSSNKFVVSSVDDVTDELLTQESNLQVSIKKSNPSDNVIPSSASTMSTFASSSNRKLLMQARDSIETKLKNKDSTFTGDEDDFFLESRVDDEDVLSKMKGMHIVETANVAVKHQKYFVEPTLTPDMEAAIVRKWQTILGAEVRVIVAQIRKFTAASGLGISLEGTVDVEGGKEVRPHHYIRSILAEGPVGQNGLLKSGDELLEVNGQRLLGMNHLEVVSILKELPQDVRMVCGRGIVEMIPFTEESLRQALEADGGIVVQTNNGAQSLMPADRLVKAKSDGSLATSSTGGDFTKMKSRSLEPLTGLAMWSSEPQIIELVKGERGLGFSILDYQDPIDPQNCLIVIRSLVPGGVAQMDGRLIPGDRLLFVNDIILENASLDQAVAALKGAQKGIVKIGVAKPLPLTDTSLNNLDRAGAGETHVSKIMKNINMKNETIEE